MHVAFLTPPFPKYSETFIINQVAALLERGHEVTVFCRGRLDSPAEHGMIESYDLLDHTVYVDSIDTYREGISELLSAVRRRNGTAELLGSVRLDKRGPDRLASQRALRARPDFDVYHAHFGPVARHWDFVSDIDGDTPFIATYYGYDVTKHLHPDNYDFYTKHDHWDRVDLAIGISEHIRSRMLMAGCPESISTTLPLGINPDLFQFSPTPLDSEAKLQLVSTCRHTPKKGLEYAIRAVGELATRGVEVDYTIAGDGELTSRYRDVVNELGLSDAIEFIGRVPQERVAELMKSVHLYVQPSVTAPNGDMEGQGLVFQEAQATGTPPVATFHDGIPEGVRHGETGRLVPERAVERLADEIEYFIQNPDKLDSYAKRGRELIESQFDYRTIAGRQVDLYESILG